MMDNILDSVVNFFHDLQIAYRLLTTGLVEDHRHQKIDGEGHKDATGDAVEVVHDTCREPMLQHGRKAALEDIGAEDSRQHANEEEVALGDGKAHLGRDEGDDREPVYPNQRIEDVEQESREEELPVMGNMLGAELQTTAGSGSLLDLAAPSKNGENSSGNTSDDGDIDVVKDGGEVVETEICKHREHHHHDEDIAQTDPRGKGDRPSKPMMYTILYQ